MRKNLKPLVHMMVGALVMAAHWIEDLSRQPRRTVRSGAQSMVEYAIIAALVAVVALVAVKALGSTVGEVFQQVTSCVASTNTSAGKTCP